jgi:hypothetical protein
MRFACPAPVGAFICPRWRQSASKSAGWVEVLGKIQRPSRSASEAARARRRQLSATLSLEQVGTVGAGAQHQSLPALRVRRRTRRRHQRARSCRGLSSSDFARLRELERATGSAGLRPDGASGTVRTYQPLRPAAGALRCRRRQQQLAAPPGAQARGDEAVTVSQSCPRRGSPFVGA